MRTLLLYGCRVLVLATLLLWGWLLWKQENPDLLLFPAAVIYLGLSFFRMLHLSTILERGEAFGRICRIGCCVFLMVVTFHLVGFAQTLGASIVDAPVPRSPILQGIIQGVYWSFAALMGVMVLFRLPEIERWLNAWARSMSI